MKNPNITDSHPVTYEMQVNLYMLRSLMLNRVGGPACFWRAGCET
jgi:hypothetical protein